MSKGSWQRKSQIKEKDVSLNWDKAFCGTKEPDVNVEFACYCEKINLIRAEYNMTSKIYTKNDKARFNKAHKDKYK